MKKVAALLAILALLVSGCFRTQASYRRFSRVVLDAFDTAVTLTCYAESEAAFDRAADAFETELWRLDAIFDRYEEHPGVSGLWALNAAAGEWVEVEPELYEVLDLCGQWREIGDGRVNIALGAVLDIWHDYREGGVSVPSMDLLREAATHADPDLIELEPNTNRVRISDPDMRVDLGAVAKGWAVERLAKLLEQSCPDYLIDAGGNIRVGTRAHDEKDTWGIGVTNPASPADILLVLRLTHLSAVTSGGYQRYYEVDGVRYHHLIDPDTLMPANHVLQVTILAEDSALADYLSTTIFLMPYASGREIIDALDGVEAIWVLTDETIEMTEGAAALLAE